MTDLQTSLIAIGGALLIGVISYNKWQEFKAKKSVERAFSSEHDDVLMTSDSIKSSVAHAATGERHEPSMNSVAGTANQVGDAAQEQPPSTFAPGTSFKELPIDPLIDCAILFVLENPVRGEKVLPVLQTLRHVGNKAVNFIGQRQNQSDDAAEGSWEPIAHGAVYATLQAGVQLANRSNALNELEYSELVTRLRHVADEIGAELELPDMMEIMGHAKELHQFVADHDVQLGVNVQSNGAPWGIATLLTVFEKQGFDLRPDGRFVMPDGDGGFLFSLSTNVTYASETTSRLTLLLNVPCVAAGRDAFGAMIACAKSQEARLDGSIVDDGNQVLGDAALGEIAGQVKAFYDDMQAAEIPAGSTRAQRLFN
ncbi:MAG: cell division protein ZipA C-terminal FtsZ-binding domain-containing protein [Pseudomonadota bacterium]